MDVNAKYPPLSSAEIVQGMIACRINARELLNESALLASHRHFARGYALVHTACEELAKFYILELAGKRIAQGRPPVWQRFWKRYRAHENKLTQLNIQLLLLLDDGDDAARSTIECVEQIFALGLRPRNFALYVDVNPKGQFCRPGELEFEVGFPTLKRVAVLALDAADRRGASGDEIENFLREPPTILRKAAAEKVLLMSLERMKDTGYQQHEIIQMLERLFEK